MPVNFVVQSSNITNFRVLIHSDCQAAIDSIINNIGTNTLLLAEIRKNINSLQNKSISVEFCWVPGHASIQANEMADVEAKNAASITKSWSANDDNSPIMVKEVKKEMSKALQKKFGKDSGIPKQRVDLHTVCCQMLSLIDTNWIELVVKP